MRAGRLGGRQRALLSRVYRGRTGAPSQAPLATCQRRASGAATTVLRLYPRQNQHSSVHFLGEIRRALPFPIKKLQCDNGMEFPLAFKLAVEAAGIKHRYIKPRRPQQNGKVERSHRIDAEEFGSRYDFDTVASAEVSLAEWERRYNHERFSMALRGRTPMEKLRAALPAVVSTDNDPDVQ